MMMRTCQLWSSPMVGCVFNNFGLGSVPDFFIVRAQLSCDVGDRYYARMVYGVDRLIVSKGAIFVRQLTC